MTRLLLILAAAYAASTAAGAAAGVAVAVPWTFLVLLGIVIVPLAHGVIVSTRLADVALARGSSGRRHLAAAALGMVPLLLVRTHSVPFLIACGGLGVAFLWSFRGTYRRRGGALLSALAILWVGYATVWSLNYLVALATAERLHDATLRAVDLGVYRALFGGDVQYAGLFPLVRGAVAVTVLENAYLFLFVEIVALVLALSAEPERLRRFLGALFGCYFVGIAVFVAYPAVGPCIRYPESFDGASVAPMTAHFMRQMAAEYRAATSGGAVNGFAYFVAVPSLHVAVATLAQLFWRREPVRFWTFLPINVLMILSTVLLGYHYLVDVPTAMILAVAVFALSGGRPALPAVAPAVWKVRAWAVAGLSPGYRPPVAGRAGSLRPRA